MGSLLRLWGRIEIGGYLCETAAGRTAAINNRIEFANSLRGIAALFVVASHVFGLFWFGRSTVARITGMPELSPDIASPFWAGFAHVAAFNFGAFGVSVFFLISGFVIPFSLRRATAGRFLLARIIRLFPTYVACFTVVILAIAVGTAYFGVPYPYAASEVFYHYVLGLRAIMASRGIDSVAWTLEVEILFYLLCAGAAPLIRVRSLWVFLIPPAITAMFAFASLQPEHFAPNVLGIVALTPYVVFLFVGTVLHLVYVKALDWRGGLLIGAGLLVVWAIGWTVAIEPSLRYVWPSYLYGLALFGLCYNFPKLLPTNRVTSFFAEISYPLYLIHAVSSYVIMRILLDQGCPAELATVAALAFAVSTATAIHFLVEQPTHRLSAALQRRPIAGATAQPEPVLPIAPLAS